MNGKIEVEDISKDEFECFSDTEQHWFMMKFIRSLDQSVKQLDTVQNSLQSQPDKCKDAFISKRQALIFGGILTVVSVASATLLSFVDWKTVQWRDVISILSDMLDII